MEEETEPKICGAVYKKDGSICQNPPVEGKKRCPRHGGNSTGPKTLEGKHRSRLNRVKHGAYLSVEILSCDICKLKEDCGEYSEGDKCYFEIKEMEDYQEWLENEGSTASGTDKKIKLDEHRAEIAIHRKMILAATEGKGANFQYLHAIKASSKRARLGEKLQVEGFNFVDEMEKVRDQMEKEQEEKKGVYADVEPIKEEPTIKEEENKTKENDSIERAE